MTEKDISTDWHERPSTFPDSMTPVEIAMFLLLDQAGHAPISAYRQERAGVGQLREWLGRWQNSAVVLGSVSPRLRCCDYDDEAACGGWAFCRAGRTTSCGVATSGPSHGLVICGSSGRGPSRPYGVKLRQRREAKDA